MKSIIKLFVCGIFFFSLSSVFAQQPAFSTQIIYFPDSSYLGYSDTFSVSVKNLDTALYSDYVNIYVSADTIAFSVASLCSIPQITIPALDSVLIPCNINFDSTYFNAGNNIVVVWSSGNAKTPADSIRRNVYLKTTGAGVGEHPHAFSFFLYPSLANNHLHVDFQKPDLTPKKIRVLDVYGREMKVFSVSKNEKKKHLLRLRKFVYL